MNTFPCTGIMGPPWGQGVGLTHKKPRCGEGDSEAASAEPWLVGTEGELQEEAGRPAFSPDAESSASQPPNTDETGCGNSHLPASAGEAEF